MMTSTASGTPLVFIRASASLRSTTSSWRAANSRSAGASAFYKQRRIL